MSRPDSCPVCGNRQSFVLKTVQPRRVRECRACGERWWTVEIFGDLIEATARRRKHKGRRVTRTTEGYQPRASGRPAQIEAERFKKGLVKIPRVDD